MIYTKLFFKLSKFFIFFILILILLEIFFRFVGFGSPILYEVSNNNYYPKVSQENRRFLGKFVNINNVGMRSSYNWKNNNNKKKLIFFGDSVTFAGSYIDNKDVFAEKICKIYLKNYECGNFGVNGYFLENLTERIKYIHKELENYDIIVIVVSSSFYYGKSSIFDMPLYQKFNYKLFKSLNEIINHILFKHKIINRYNNINPNFEKKENYGKSVEEQFSDFKNLMKQVSKNEKNYIFVLPTLEDLKLNNIKKHFLMKTNINNLRVINLYKDIKNLNYQDLYFNNAHLNEKGHDYLSKIIYEYIDENKK